LGCAGVGECAGVTNAGCSVRGQQPNDPSASPMHSRHIHVMTPRSWSVTTLGTLARAGRLEGVCACGVGCVWGGGVLVLPWPVAAPGGPSLLAGLWPLPGSDASWVGGSKACGLPGRPFVRGPPSRAPTPASPSLQPPCVAAGAARDQAREGPLGAGGLVTAPPCPRHGGSVASACVVVGWVGEQPPGDH
jgi:hypothetical protein